MRKVLWVIGLALIAPPAFAQLSFSPQAGINIARLSDDLPNQEQLPRAGFHAGSYFRLGDEVVFLQPGIFWQQTSISLRNRRNPTAENHLDFGGIQTPVLLGVKAVASRVFELRFVAGPSLWFVTDVQDNPYNVTKDRVRNTIWGVTGGIGVQVLILSLDISYEHGLSRVFEHDFQPGASSKNNVVRFTGGFRF